MEFKNDIMTAITMAGGASGVQFDPERPLRDYGITSLGLYEFISKLEQQTRLQIPDEALDEKNFQSLGAVDKLLIRVSGQQ